MVASPSGIEEKMADENKNGKNGNQVSLLVKVKAGIKEDLQSLKTDMPAKAKEQIEGLKDPTKTQVYTSSSATSTTTRRAIARWPFSRTFFCICIRRKLIAMRCVTATPGAWAESLFICLSC